MENTNIFIPIGKQIESHVTRVTPGGSLRERLAAARQKAVVEPSTADIPEKSKPVVEIQLAKDAELDIRIIKRVMDSTILGMVEVAFDTHKPDQARVGGVVYNNDELVDLLGRDLSAADLRAVHEVKQAFEGKVGIT
jgi:hypothetical protein